MDREEGLEGASIRSDRGDLSQLWKLQQPRTVEFTLENKECCYQAKCCYTARLHTGTFPWRPQGNSAVYRFMVHAGQFCRSRGAPRCVNHPGVGQACDIPLVLIWRYAASSLLSEIGTIRGAWLLYSCLETKGSASRDEEEEEEENDDARPTRTEYRPRAVWTRRRVTEAITFFGTGNVSSSALSSCASAVRSG